MGIWELHCNKKIDKIPKEIINDVDYEVSRYYKNQLII